MNSFRNGVRQYLGFFCCCISFRRRDTQRKIRDNLNVAPFKIVDFHEEDTEVCTQEELSQSLLVLGRVESSARLSLDERCISTV